MAIVNVPAGISITKTVSCTVCQHSIDFINATAGFRDAQNEQTFACNAHFRSGGQYIVGWVDFVASERQMQFMDVEYTPEQEGGANVAWSLY